MKKTLFLCLSILIFSGCKSNPYPDGSYTAQRPQQEAPTIVNYFIDAPNKVNFSEGIQGSFTIHGMVPQPGVAQITLSGLPNGAVYSDVDQSITWTPDYNAGNDPNNATSGSRDYTLTITLSSSLVSKTIIDKIVTLTVYDTPRTYNVTGLDAASYLSEGTVFNAAFQIQDLDSPNGPFVIGQSGAPDGITFTADPNSPGNYSISFLPSYGLVDSVFTSASNNAKDFNWTLLVSDARGKMISVPLVWHINDVRQQPLYVGPGQFSVKSTELDFIFQAQDPNLEIEPTAILESANSGSVDITPLPPMTRVKGQTPSQAFHVHWSNIPPEKLGGSEDLKFKICVYGTDHGFDQCIDQTVTVTFVAPPPPPVNTPTPIASPTPIPTPTPTPTPTGHFSGGRL